MTYTYRKVVKKLKVNQQYANVKSAAARLAQAQAEANKNILRAPFDGVITNIYIKLVSPAENSRSRCVKHLSFQLTISKLNLKFPKSMWQNWYKTLKAVFTLTRLGLPKSLK